MKTDDLIASLAADAGTLPRPSLSRSAAVAMLAGLVMSAIVFLLVLGTRPNLDLALRAPVTLAKTLLPLALAAAALPLTLRSARPGLGRSRSLPGVMIVLLVLAALALLGWSFASTPPGLRMAIFVGHSVPVCLPMIAVLSAPIAGLMFRALRAGAPVHPARCGALIGMSAAGIAAALYSLFCTEDAPLYYVFWYGTGIAIVTVVSAWAGSRLLRW